MSTYSEKHLAVLREGGWLDEGPVEPDLPDIPAENRVFLRLLGVLALVAGLLCGVYAYLASPAAANLDLRALGRLVSVRRFYAALPADLAGRQAVVALGDSITVGSIDCNLLDELLGPEQISYNLATPGKTHPEYLLDTAEPLLAGATVVTLVNPGATYAPQAIRLGQRRANIIRVLDYPLERDGWRAFDALLPDSGVDYLLRPKLVHVFESRWRIEENIGTWLQARSPLTPRQTKDAQRYQRMVYARNLKAAAMPVEATAEANRKAIDGRVEKTPDLYAPDYKPGAEALATWGFVVEQLSATAERVVLVNAPQHPLQREALGDVGNARFMELMEGYAARYPNVTMLDLSTLLDESGFRDEIHPNAAGAQAITREVAEALERLSLQRQDSD